MSVFETKFWVFLSSTTGSSIISSSIDEMRFWTDIYQIYSASIIYVDRMVDNFTILSIPKSSFEKD